MLRAVYIIDRQGCVHIMFGDRPRVRIARKHGRRSAWVDRLPQTPTRIGLEWGIVGHGDALSLRLFFLSLALVLHEEHLESSQPNSLHPVSTTPWFVGASVGTPQKALPSDVFVCLRAHHWILPESWSPHRTTKSIDERPSESTITFAPLARREKERAKTDRARVKL